MKNRAFPPLFLAMLAAAILLGAFPVREALAQSQTEVKIRLMSEALRARDTGDLAAAQRALAELATLSPNDPVVQRLQSEIEAQTAANRAAREQQVAAEAAIAAAQAEATAQARARAQAQAQAASRSLANQAAAPAPAVSSGASSRSERPAMIDVTIPDPGRTPSPAVSPLEQEAEALARAESERLSDLVSNGQRQLATARTQLQDGRPADAIATVDNALATLPRNPLTQRLVADLQREKASALFERAQALLQRGDTDGARSALAQYNELSPGNPRATNFQRQLAQAEARVASAARAPASVDPEFAAERAGLAQLIARGRAQYVAGDIDGAQETFRMIEAQEPDNTVAKGFLLRIAEEKAETGVLNREKTRAQLLEEVAKSWQRPGIYEERARDTGTAAAVAPLARKLTEIVIPVVNWTRAPLADVVASLAEISEKYDPAANGVKGVNVVLLDPTNRNPAVTLTLRNATLKRVLDFITEAVGYQYEVQADAVVVRPGGETTTLDTAFFPVTRATVLRMTGISTGAVSGAGRDPYSTGGVADTEPTVTGGEAASMRAFLQQAGVSFTGEGSSLAYDGSAIIVTQTPRNLDRIRNILMRYNDVRQVEIEAKFMEVQEGAMEELGVTWNLSRRGVPQINPATGAPVLDSNGRQIFVPRETYTSGGVTRPLFSAFPSTSNQNAITISDGTSGINVPVAPAQIPGGVQLGAVAGALANITGFVGEFDVSATVRALSQKQGTDLLSSPKITVLSGNPANITVAQELRYPQSYGEIQSQVGSGAASGATGISSAGVTITAGTPQEFTSRNVGVELKVTPTVEEDDYSISLDLNPRVTEFEGFVEYGGPSVAISSGVTVTVPPGFYQPIFSVRDISTKVTIWDGATLVMGGLTREEVKKVNDKVPFFGDIPLIGRLFRSKGDSAQKRNLLIFVTANLVSPGGSPKQQNLKSTPANSLFQNPPIVTPASSEPRTRSGGK